MSSLVTDCRLEHLISNIITESYNSTYNSGCSTPSFFLIVKTCRNCKLCAIFNLVLTKYSLRFCHKINKQIIGEVIYYFNYVTLSFPTD